MKDSILLTKADEYAHGVYRITKSFPNSEQFGIISQLRRAALSVSLNIVEGFSRQGSKEFQQFLRTSYASLQEAQHLLKFSLEEKYLTEDSYKVITELGEEVAKMLWVSLRTLRNAQ